jgi:mycothiol synthase
MSRDSTFPLRPASLEDVDAILAVVAAAELAANGEVDVDREDIESEFALPGVDPGRHTIVVERDDGVVAWAVLEAERGTTYADVDPDHRGRGIGSRVAEWCEEAARAAGLPEVGQTRSDAEADAQELLRSRGWVPRWTSWMLEFVMGDDEPAPPGLPDGIRIREFEPGLDDREAHRVVDDAFGEWEGRGEQSFDEWVGHTVGRATFDPRLSPVAADGDEIVGVAISLAYEGDEDGYVHQLAVRRSHRSRGIGRALLVEAFRGFHRLGRRSVVLSTESRTGALTMYERVGMRVRRSYTSYAKQLSAQGD